MDNAQNLKNLVEGILFWKNEPTTFKTLAEYVEASESDVKEAITSLQQDSTRGFVYVTTDTTVEIKVSPHIEPIITKLQKKDLEGELGRAGLETLAILLYNGASSRKEIEFIRGVQSQYILRLLTIRGLIERRNDKEKQYVYALTTDALAYVGLAQAEQAPEFSEINQKLRSKGHDQIPAENS